MGEKERRLHLYVVGEVQGVFFRSTAQQRARALGVTGWVRNLRDGRVEIVAEGMTNAVEALVRWARKGPSQARVHDLEIHREAYTGEFEDFRIRY